MQIDIETVLAIIITAIALNLIFVGFYIVNLLREVRRTVAKAGAMIDDVDRSVKDGIGKVAAIERPLQALATTSVALAGVLKGTPMVKKATESILEAMHPDEANDAVSKNKKPKWFKRSK